MWGSRKVVFFLHKSMKERFAEKSTLYLRELTMKESLTPSQEEQAQNLAQSFTQAAYNDLLRILCLLPEAHPRKT